MAEEKHLVILIIIILPVDIGASILCFLGRSDLVRFSMANRAKVLQCDDFGSPACEAL
jgi:hypothetical protein